MGSQTLIALSGLICGILSSLVLILFPGSRKTANVFLGISVLFLTHILLCSLLNNSGGILEVPFLMRTGNFSIYLFAPFLYLFYRGVFKGEKNWKPIYFLFFLPSVIYIIDYFPFFALPADEKISLFSRTLSNPAELIKVNEGLFGWSNFHFTFRTLWSALFIFLIGKILLDYRGDFRKSYSSRDVLFYSRLVALWGIVFVFLLLPALSYLFFQFKEYTQIFVMISVASTLFLITINLLFSPRLLYGYYWVYKDNSAEAMVLRGQDINSTESEDLKLLNDLKTMVLEKSLYENSGFTIHKLAQEADMPSYRISYLVNSYTDGNFSNWINSFRVAKFITLVENGDAEKYTLDSIAPACGFSSRSTLITSFKREMGTTPGQYLKLKSFNA